MELARQRQALLETLSRCKPDEVPRLQGEIAGLTRMVNPEYDKELKEKFKKQAVLDGDDEE